LAQAKAHDPEALGLDEVLSGVVNRTWKSNSKHGSAGAAQRRIALAVLRSLLTCVASKDAALEVRGACWVALDDINTWIRDHSSASEWSDVYAFASHAIPAAGAATLQLPIRRALVLDPM
jgi:hypothetical protein